jgi:cytochrome P450
MALSLSTSEIRALSFAILAFSVVYYCIGKFLRRRHICRVEAEHGAKPPIWLTEVWKPKHGGLVRETVAAIREHRWLDLINARHEAGGYTYQTTAIFGHFYHTSEPENIKAMLATKFEDWDLGNRMPAVGPLLGGGVFTNDGKHWETSRSLVRPSFVKAEISDMSMLERHVQQLFAHIPKDGSTFDLQELFLKLACMSCVRHC